MPRKDYKSFMKKFGEFIKARREDLAQGNPLYSQRQISKRIGIEQSYLSKIERGLPASLSEEKILLLAKELDVDSDYLLALGGKISNDIQEVIKKRPELFSRLIREMRDIPDAALHTEKEFRCVINALNNLHTYASIGAFRFSNNKNDSFWTDQVVKILGLDPKASPSLESVLAVFDKRTIERIAEEEDRSRQTGTPAHLVASFEDENGEVKHIEVWGQFEKASKNNDEVRLGIIQDVTANVTMRDQIDEANRILEQKTDEQSKTIAEAIAELKAEGRKRERYQSKLKKLNEEVNRKAATQLQGFKEVAFQIRTLASQILSKKVIDDAADSELNEKLSQLVIKVENLGDLINEGAETHTEIFNLSEVIQSSIESLLTKKTESQEIVYTQAPGFPELVTGDRSRIDRVLKAILELMLLLTPWGNILLTTKINAGDRTMLDMVFYSSTPAGTITEEDFYPGTEPSKALELTNPVRWIGPVVDKIGGSITLTMASKDEISIRVSLPIGIVEEDKQGDQKSASHTEISSVLVVEDDPFNRLFLEKGLEGQGMTVESVTTGQEALEKVKNQAYSLILLDIQLPDINGIEVAKVVRNEASSVNSETPILAVTAHAAPSDRKRFCAAGIDDTIAKPFELESLLKKIKNLRG